MSTLRLTHPTRGTLEFRQAQRDEAQRQAVASITAEIGVDRTPLVHTETRETTREVSGRVTAPRRARNDPDTGDWRQALANYADRLEAHVDEYQGDGYTLEDDILDTSKQAILESVGWELAPGQPYELQFTATAQIGRGVFDAETIDRRNPTINDALDTYIEVDGVACPGMRTYQMDRSLGVDPQALFDRDTAENNDILTESGVQQNLVFEGTHTGTREERRQADAALNELLGTKNAVTLDTYFPGYTLEGFVTAYNSNFQASFGTGKHDYRLEFVEGQRA